MLAISTTSDHRLRWRASWRSATRARARNTRWIDPDPGLVLIPSGSGWEGVAASNTPSIFSKIVRDRWLHLRLWCITRPDLFAPALAQAGLSSDRVIYLEAGDDKTVLACAEEGLRHGGLGAVVAEVARLSMIASRRLQLAAEGNATIGIALRRWRRQTEAAQDRARAASGDRGE